MNLETAIEIQRKHILNEINSYDFCEVIFYDYIVDFISLKLKLIIFENQASITCYTLDTYQTNYNEEIDRQKTLFKHDINYDPINEDELADPDDEYERYIKVLSERIDENLKFIHDFSIDYSYSCILDTYILKDFKKDAENIYMSKAFLTHKPIGKCGNCEDTNTVLTSCEHNLCRQCYADFVGGNKHFSDANSNEINLDDDININHMKECILCPDEECNKCIIFNHQCR
jgi:hypothetical protein